MFFWIFLNFWKLCIFLNFLKFFEYFQNIQKAFCFLNFLNIQKRMVNCVDLLNVCLLNIFTHIFKTFKKTTLFETFLQNFQKTQNFQKAMIHTRTCARVRVYTCERSWARPQKNYFSGPFQSLWVPFTPSDQTQHPIKLSIRWNATSAGTQHPM